MPRPNDLTVRMMTTGASAMLIMRNSCEPLTDMETEAGFCIAYLVYKAGDRGYSDRVIGPVTGSFGGDLHKAQDEGIDPWEFTLEFLNRHFPDKEKK